MSAWDVEHSWHDDMTPAEVMFAVVFTLGIWFVIYAILGKYRWLFLALGLVVLYPPVLLIIVPCLVYAAILVRRDRVAQRRRLGELVRSFQIANGSTVSVYADAVLLVTADSQRVRYPLNETKPADLATWPDVQAFLRARSRDLRLAAVALEKG